MLGTVKLVQVNASAAMVWFLGLAACASTPLDYDTALSLLRDRAADPIRISFSASPSLDDPDTETARAYQRLIDEHVIQCKKTPAVGTLCEPGPAGDALSAGGISELSLVAGRWVPAAIAALQRTGRNSAVADVRMSFEPSVLYRDFEDALVQIQTPASRTALGNRREGKLVHVTFQHYAEGWHIESVE